MPKIQFSVNVPASADKLVEIATDFEKLPEFSQELKSVKIIEKKNDETITQEDIDIYLPSVNIHHKISQQSSHKLVEPNKLQTQIISGPLKGSKITILYESNDGATKVFVDADIKTSLKYKALGPLIKKFYRVGIPAILFKMASKALGISN